MLVTGLALLALCFGALAVDTVVNLGYSQYQGTAQSNGISSWLGIRFAAPPLGDLRWRAPQDPLLNSTLQLANQHGLICLGTNGSPTDNTTSEDCLFLDVYAPTNASTSSKLPVFLWIQGGGYNTNSNANYKGDGLITASGMNMVVVTFNYRVSIWGFLASQEILNDGDTNIGLLDQRKVMEWVQQYISLFGGDPGHVTLGGASAGAGSVALHLTAYGGRNDNLFHATVAESQFFPVMLTIPQAQFQYDGLVRRAGCANTSDSLSCLRTVNASHLQSVNSGFPYPSLPANASVARYPYGPVIDGGIIEDYTYRLLTWGSIVKVPIIFGDDSNEGTHFAPTNTSSFSGMDQWLLAQYPALNASELSTINSMYPKNSSSYPNNPNNATGPYYEAASAAYGEICLICPGIQISSIWHEYVPQLGNWNYRYNVLDPAQAAQGLGVSHTVETGALWGIANVPGTPLSSYLPNGTNAAITPVLQGYWTSFIRTYDPNTYRAPGTPVWEPWAGKQRLLFVTNATAMESVPQDQLDRCQVLRPMHVMKVDANAW